LKREKKQRTEEERRLQGKLDDAAATSRAQAASAEMAIADKDKETTAVKQAAAKSILRRCSMPVSKIAGITMLTSTRWRACVKRQRR
jgi:hypothetical protein